MHKTSQKGHPLPLKPFGQEPRKNQRVTISPFRDLI